MGGDKLSSPIETVSWINAERRETGFRRLARIAFKEKHRDPAESQTVIPAQDIPVLRETNPDLADLLQKQLDMRLTNANRVLLPVVDSKGNITFAYKLPTKPLGVVFTVNGPIEKER
jgi:hypothetical protein